MARWEEKEQSHSEQIRQINESKRLVLNLLYEVERLDVDHHSPILNGKKSSDVIKDLHSAILIYHDSVRPVRDVVEEMWNEAIYTVDIFGNKHDIALSDLEDWRGWKVEVSETVSHPVAGTTEEWDEYRLWLPPAASSAAFYQINDIINEVDLWVELPEQSIDIMKHEPL